MSTDRHEDRIRIGELGPGYIALLRNVSDEAAAKAVRNAFIAIGIDPDDPIKAQDIFALLRTMGDEEFRDDLHWTRRNRRRTEGFFGKAVVGFVSVGVLAGAQALWAGARALIGAVSIQGGGHP
jgi:hypothetical protein